MVGHKVGIVNACQKLDWGCSIVLVNENRLVIINDACLFRLLVMDKNTYCVELGKPKFLSDLINMGIKTLNIFMFVSAGAHVCDFENELVVEVYEVKTMVYEINADLGLDLQKMVETFFLVGCFHRQCFLGLEQYNSEGESVDMVKIDFARGLLGGHLQCIKYENDYVL